ncbi:MAG: hypothetical protein HQL66_15105 [Magnetococcales bacterium]|nr:hypothetical protein [Magnetococcales bacterium]
MTSPLLALRNLLSEPRPTSGHVVVVTDTTAVIATESGVVHTAPASNLQPGDRVALNDYGATRIPIPGQQYPV